MTTDLLSHPRTLVLAPPGAEVLDAATRREFLVMLGAAGLLAACGDEGPPMPELQATTQRVTHEFGTFDVPLEPQRLVVLEGRSDLEAVLALGLDPIAVGENAFAEDGSVASFLEWDPSDVTPIGQLEALDLEQLAALDPDLLVGRATNIEEVASELAATVALVQPLGDGTAYSGRTTSLYLQLRTLAELGGRNPPYVEQEAPVINEAGSVQFSLELLGEFASADALLVVDNSGSSAELDSNPLWQRLPAVAAGRVFVADGRTNQGSVFAARECLRLLDRLYSTLP